MCDIISYQSAHRVCHVTMLNGPRFINIKSKHLGSSSAIFGNFWKMFGNIHMTTGQHFQNLRKSSENRQKPRY